MANRQNHNQSKHIPVLLDDVLAMLAPQVGESYLDVTAGYGGHASEVLGITQAENASVLVDRDENATSQLEVRFAGARILQQDFLGASKQLLAEGQQFDMILADLGLSSPHLDDASRGFAISEDAPLDMRMDARQNLTAETIVNSYSEAELASLLKRYGEEPKARLIARKIVQARPLASTSELAKLVASAWPGHSKIHPATRTFQAIRLAVNDELGQLEASLPIWLDLLVPGGRLAVISFHSLEDRLVKQALAEASGQRYDARLRLLTKRPIEASSNELVFNPRARSAKLRAAAKIKIQKGEGL
jgi:16S rRNA (cytosine1402-N4)-methyltransferase